MTTELVSEISVQLGEHLVQFYDRESELAESVGRYVVDGARAGEIAVLIATPAHRRAFAAEFEHAGIDLEQASRDGEVVMLDAAATLSKFTRGGQVEREGFMRVVGGVLRDTARAGRPIRAYGEMVALLWEAGDVLAAIELEKLWNELGHELPFTLFCAYPSESVSGHHHMDALERSATCTRRSCLRQSLRHQVLFKVLPRARPWLTSDPTPARPEPPGGS